MSTFSYETMTLLNDGDYRRATLYVLGSIGGSIAAVLAGIESAKRLL